MVRKYRMSVADNVLFAKRNLVDSIWKEANIEGIAVTFPETKEVFEGRVVPGLTVDETVAINNLKRAWGFVLDNLDAPVDLAFVRQVNGIVGAGIVSYPGDLRMYDVSIGGTAWKPSIPDRDAVVAFLAEACTVDDPQDRALFLFSGLCRAQLFSDGNKRTAQLVANKELVANGAGILAIAPGDKPEFERLLVGYYETADATDLEAFLVDRAVDGFQLPA
jgi:hypothetical protein